MNYLTYALWDAAPENQKWYIIEYKDAKKLNAGRPWLCATEEEGLTGVVGMLIEADCEEDAKKKMLKIIEEYKSTGKEPNVWR